MTRGTYLVAKDIDRREMRIFKLDRIRDAQVLDADADVPSDFELQKMVASSQGIWTHDKLVKVELLLVRAPPGERSKPAGTFSNHTQVA